MNKYLIFFPGGRIHNKCRLMLWKDVPIALMQYYFQNGSTTEGWGVLETVTVWQLPAGDNTLLKRVPLAPLRVWLAQGEFADRYPEPVLA